MKLYKHDMETGDFARVIMLCVLITYVDCGCKDSLGLDYNTPTNKLIPDDQLSASTEEPYFLAKFGRINQQKDIYQKMREMWCAVEDDPKPWFQVDFVTMTTVTGVAVGSFDSSDAYVLNYVMMYSYDEKIWYNITDRNTGLTKLFSGPKSGGKTKEQYFPDPITARFFRIYPRDYEERVCMQTDLCGCKPKITCGQSVGIKNNQSIPDSAMTSSSVFHNHQASTGRLNATPNTDLGNWGAWCALASDILPWLQVDLLHIREISHLITQGLPNPSVLAWVRTYKFNYSLNGMVWSTYGGYNMNLAGNSDSNSLKVNKLNKTVRARFIRFVPTDSSQLPCMRVEVYECKPNAESIPKLVNKLDDVMMKRGQALRLECQFIGQPKMVASWNLNGKYLQTNHRIYISENPPNQSSPITTVTSILHIDPVKSSEDGAAFSCLAWYPTLGEVRTQSTAVLHVAAPIPSLSIIKVTKSSVLIFINFTGPLTIDAEGYFVRTRRSYDTAYPITKKIPLSNSTTVDVSGLRPYTNYTSDIAMLYTGLEVGKFFSRKHFQTLQDVPEGPPLKLYVEKRSHNSLHCQWLPPDESLRNGIVTQYEVRYKKSVKEDDQAHSKQQPFMFRRTTQNTLLLDSLEPGAVYEITVCAFTVIGTGPFVQPPALTFTGKATEELTRIKELVVTKDNAVSISTRLKNITADQKFLNKHDVVLTLDILEKVVTAQNTSELIGDTLVEAVSNILKANKTVLSESEITNRTGTRYVKMLEKWLEGVEFEQKKLEEESENVVVRKVYVNKLKIEEGIKFEMADADAEIEIPREAAGGNDSVYFVYYKKNKFFQAKQLRQELCIDGFTVIKERKYTPVISGEVTGRTTTNLSAPVVVKFKHDGKSSLKDTACAYWENGVDNEQGSWSTDGCKLQSIVNDTITCHCNHLTNFAAMMDVYAQTSVICGKHQKIVSLITVIGCFFSLIGLFFTFLTYFMFRKLLKEMAAKVLVQLCAALFIVVLTFVTGIEQTDKPMMCMTVAFVLHYFTLVTFMWMLMEASFMYHAFVRVWPPRQGGDIYRSTIVAWGIPLFIVGITFLTSMDSYGGKNYCHLTGIPLIAAYLAPIGLIIFINFVVFMFIMRRLSMRPNSNTDQSNSGAALARVRRAFGIMILMGLTWAFGFGSVTGARLEFTYLFAIFNASQGFAIFIFYCVAQKRARMQWWAFFTCDNRTENKRNTDSYYFERGRMSSTVSNRTNTMQFNRLSSNASSVLVTSGSMNGQAATLMNKTPMNTIDEMESPIRGMDSEPDYPILLNMDSPENKQVVNEPPVDQLEETDLNDSNGIEEDELLNQKIQVSEDSRKPRTDSVKQYSSYRVLSSAKSYDVLNLVKTPCGKTIDDVTLRKSHEHIHRKESQKNKRRSMVVDSVNNIKQRDDEMRPVKSLEHINKQEGRVSEIPSEDLDLMSFKRLDSKCNVVPSPSTVTTDLNTIDDKTVPKNRMSDVADADIRPSSMDTGTLKSDAATMTENIPAFRSPLALVKADGCSKEDIMQWLDDCDENPKDSDSDYSSSFYKTSRSSSMTDVMTSSNTRLPSVSTGDAENRRSAEKQLLDNIMGPLKGGLDNNNARTAIHSNDEYIESDFSSEQNYSASEEDMFVIGKTPTGKTALKNKSRKLSTGFTKPSGYVTLDDPTSHASYA